MSLIELNGLPKDEVLAYLKTLPTLGEPIDLVGDAKKRELRAKAYVLELCNGDKTDPIYEKVASEWEAITNQTIVTYGK